MRYPPRLSHLATLPVLVAKLAPSYAKSHKVEDEEASRCLTVALKSPLREALLEEAWAALSVGSARATEEKLLEKVAAALQDRPLRPGRVKESTAAMSAFWIQLDLEAGTASDAPRMALESPAGQKMAAAGLKEAGAFLAGELTRKG
jgi:hypothetical protein